MTSHFPKNHRLRPLYRCASFLVGAYCLLFGSVGVAATRHDAFFDRGSHRVFGLQTNLAFAIASIVAGLIIAVVALLGRNVDRTVYMVLGPAFIVMGLTMMALLSTTADFLNFTMSTCIGSFVIGLVVMSAAFYVEVAPRELARAEEEFRRSAPDPESQLGRHP